MILYLVANHDENIRERITHGPRNATRTSPDIQNTLLQIRASMVQKEIYCKIKEAGVFLVLAGESKDCVKNEQLTIALQRVDPKEKAICEYFLTFVEAASLNAESLTEYIVDTL